jgi:hypothetical protein
MLSKNASALAGPMALLRLQCFIDCQILKTNNMKVCKAYEWGSQIKIFHFLFYINFPFPRCHSVFMPGYSFSSEHLDDYF